MLSRGRSWKIYDVMENNNYHIIFEVLRFIMLPGQVKLFQTVLIHIGHSDTWLGYFFVQHNMACAPCHKIVILRREQSEEKITFYIWKRENEDTVEKSKVKRGDIGERQTIGRVFSVVIPFSSMTHKTYN